MADTDTDSGMKALIGLVAVAALIAFLSPSLTDTSGAPAGQTHIGRPPPKTAQPTSSRKRRVLLHVQVVIPEGGPAFRYNGGIGYNVEGRTGDVDWPGSNPGAGKLNLDWSRSFEYNGGPVSVNAVSILIDGQKIRCQISDSSGRTLDGPRDSIIARVGGPLARVWCQYPGDKGAGS